jgi:opacity protein-like surface antigen
MKSLLLLALLLAVCAAIVYAAVSIEPSVSVAGPESERHYQRQGAAHWVLYEKGEGLA